MTIMTAELYFSFSITKLFTLINKAEKIIEDLKNIPFLSMGTRFNLSQTLCEYFSLLVRYDLAQKNNSSDLYKTINKMVNFLLEAKKENFPLKILFQKITSTIIEESQQHMHLEDTIKWTIFLEDLLPECEELNLFKVKFIKKKINFIIKKGKFIKLCN